MPFTFTDAILGLGVRVYDSPDGVTYTELVDLIDVGPPSDPEVEQVELVPVSPKNGNSKEYLNGLVSNGEFEFMQAYNATRYAHHKANQGTRVYYKVVVPDALNTHSFTVIVGNLKKAKQTKWSPKEVAGIECKVQVCAQEVFTAGS